MNILYLSSHAILEYDQTENSLREEIIDQYIDLKAGYLAIPEKPGIGVAPPSQREAPP